SRVRLRQNPSRADPLRPSGEIFFGCAANFFRCHYVLTAAAQVSMAASNCGESPGILRLQTQPADQKSFAAPLDKTALVVYNRTHVNRGNLKPDLAAAGIVLVVTIHREPARKTFPAI